MKDGNHALNGSAERLTEALRDLVKEAPLRLQVEDIVAERQKAHMSN